MTLGNAASLGPSAPQGVLAVGVLAAVLIATMRPRGSRNVACGIAVVTCVASAIVTVLTATSGDRVIWHGLMVRDALSDYFTLLIDAGTAAAALLAVRSSDAVEPSPDQRDAPELFALLLGAALGASVLAASRNLLLAYLAFELISLSSYLLTGFTAGSRRSAEAALKYAVYGAVASGAMLFGMSWLYGLSRSLDVAIVRDAAAAGPTLAVAPAILLVLSGVGYKMAIAPFHMWSPDVYEGAPIPVTAFLSVVSKAAGFAMALRLLGPSAELAPPLALMLLLVAVFTMTVGNLAALGQRNVKRLLAYSSIAQAGYLLLGVAVGGPTGLQAVLFYLAVYLLMNFIAFAAVGAFVERGFAETLDGWSGLGARAPLPCAVLTIALFSLVGLPPTAGFIGKYQLFAAVVGKGLAGGGGAYHAAALIGVLNSALSLAYYAKILRALYLTPAPGARVGVSPMHVALLVVMAIPLVLLGVYWSPLLDLVNVALPVVAWGR